MNYTHRDWTWKGPKSSSNPLIFSTTKSGSHHSLEGRGHEVKEMEIAKGMNASWNIGFPGILTFPMLLTVLLRDSLDQMSYYVFYASSGILGWNIALETSNLTHPSSFTEEENSPRQIRWMPRSMHLVRTKTRAQASWLSVHKQSLGRKNNAIFLLS